MQPVADLQHGISLGSYFGPRRFDSLSDNWGPLELKSEAFAVSLSVLWMA